MPRILPLLLLATLGAHADGPRRERFGVWNATTSEDGAICSLSDDSGWPLFDATFKRRNVMADRGPLVFFNARGEVVRLLRRPAALADIAAAARAAGGKGEAK